MRYKYSVKVGKKVHIVDEDLFISNGELKSLCNIENGAKKFRQVSDAIPIHPDTGLKRKVCKMCSHQLRQRLPGAKKKKKQQKLSQGKKDFLKTEAWKRLRYEAYLKMGRICMCCGASHKESRIHVDHVKPRGKYPELVLDMNNLQILCASCNWGKGGDDETDFRPKQDYVTKTYRKEK